VKLKHDIKDEDLKAIAEIVNGARGTLNGMTVTIERLRQNVEEIAAKKITFSIKLLGFKIFEAEGGLK